MAKSIKLEVITPSKLFYRGQVQLVIARTLSGDEGFMAGHTWACKLLDTGELWIQEEGTKDYKIAAVSGGFIDVKESITIFTDAAEWPSDIDISRAQTERERAMEWLKSHEPTDDEEQNIIRAKIAIDKSLTRMNVAAGGARRKR